MFKQIMDIIVITFIALGGFTHILKLINLLIGPKFFRKIRFISQGPSKTELALYYLLVIAICIYTINLKLSNFN